jgi:hypothetical protein
MGCRPPGLRRVAPRDTSQEAAAAATARDVLVALYPTLENALDLDLQQSLAQIPDGEDKTEGISGAQAVVIVIPLAYPMSAKLGKRLAVPRRPQRVGEIGEQARR